MEPVVLTARLTEAFDYAAGHFGGKLRGNTGVPAIAHAMAVAALVLNVGGQEDEAIAALLHDVVEDGGGAEALAQLERRFGSHVAGLVLACTDEVEPSGRPWRELKRDYLVRLSSAPVEALRISLADKADNTRTLLRAYELRGDALFSEHQGGSRETVLWYYEALLQAFQARRAELGGDCEPLLAELGRVIAVLRAASAANSTAGAS